MSILLLLAVVGGVDGWWLFGLFGLVVWVVGGLGFCFRVLGWCIYRLVVVVIAWFLRLV